MDLDKRADAVGEARGWPRALAEGKDLTPGLPTLPRYVALPLLLRRIRVLDHSIPIHDVRIALLPVEARLLLPRIDLVERIPVIQPTVLHDIPD
jgi:hypothetical protein